MAQRACKQLRQALSGFATALCAVVALVAFAPATRGQISSFQGSVGSRLAPPPVYTGRGDALARPGRGEEGLPVLDWLIFPSTYIGAMADSNPLQAPVGGRFGYGLRILPSVVAQREDGIHSTTVYGAADGRLFLNQANADQYFIGTGATEVYRPLADLIFNAQGNFTRQQNVFSTLDLNNNLTNLNPTGVGLSPTTGSTTYNQLSGAVSMQKNFANSFVILSGSVADITSAASLSVPNGATYTGTGRAGVWLSPDLYGYLEGSLDSRNYSAATLSSSGYRTVGGVGSDQIGLFRGEVYFGYQSEAYRSAAMGTAAGPAFGGRVFYYPLPELTVGAALDQSIGATLAATQNPMMGTATKVTSLLGNVNYSLAREWVASARGGYIHTDYVASVRRDDALTIGATITYTVSLSVGLTLDFQHIQLSSNAPLQSFTRDMATVGVSYRY